MRSFVGPIDYVGGHCSSRFVAVIACAQPALGLQKLSHVDEPVSDEPTDTDEGNAGAFETLAFERTYLFWQKNFLHGHNSSPLFICPRSTSLDPAVSATPRPPGA